MNERSEHEKLLRDSQAYDYNDRYLERGSVPVSVEDELIINSLDLSNVKSILDVGCGTGRLLSKINARYPNIEIVGLDLSSASLDVASENIPTGKFHCFDLSNGDIKEIVNKKFDRVLSVQVIQHLQPINHSHAVSQLVQSVSPNGKLVLELYNHSGLIRKIEQIMRRNLNKEVKHDLFYEYRFSPSDIEMLLRTFGKAKINGCQTIPRKLLNRFPKLKDTDMKLSRKIFSKYLAYYFIAIMEF